MRAEGRFEALDGLRGIAALLVMFYHYLYFSGSHQLFGAWLAVDLFFLLSGFVIAHAYGARIGTGMTFREFLLVRVIRLGPLYQFGLAIGLAFFLVEALALGRATVGPGWIADALFVNALGMPFLNRIDYFAPNVGYGGRDLFPFDPPAWSLFFELVVNIAFFAFLRMCRAGPGVAAVAVLVAVQIAVVAVFQVANPGPSFDGMALGLPRALSLFFAGAWLLHADPDGRWTWRRPRWVLVPALPLLVEVAFGGGNARLALVAQVICIPWLVASLAAWRVGPRAASVCAALGALSYPVYMVHWPLYWLLSTLPQVAAWPAALRIAVAAAASLALAAALVPLDAALRRRLARRWLPARVAAPA